MYHTLRTFPAHTYALVHPNIGVHMDKLVRLHIDDAIKKLINIWETAIAIAEASADDFACSPCQLCKAAKVNEEARLCSICQLCWHASCAESMSLNTGEGPPPWPSTVRTLPSIFWDKRKDGALCSLCERWIQTHARGLAQPSSGHAMKFVCVGSYIYSDARVFWLRHFNSTKLRCD